MSTVSFRRKKNTKFEAEITHSIKVTHKEMPLCTHKKYALETGKNSKLTPDSMCYESGVAHG